jgi:hypothetical protein
MEKTQTTKNGATTHITRTINVRTLGGLIAQIALTRKVINVGLTPHKTDIKYQVLYKGEIISSHDLSDKNEVKYFLAFIDKYSHKF